MWQSVESDWRTAHVSPRIRATLGFLETLTLRPDEITRDDADSVRAAGVSDDALDLALRGPSDWSAGERELFAAFVSSLSQCLF